MDVRGTWLQCCPFWLGKAHHVTISKEFAREVRNLKIGPDEELKSYDVSALFTSIQVNTALIVIKKRLEDGTILKERNPRRHS